MHIRYGYRLDILCETTTPIITMLDVHPSLRSEMTAPDSMVARSVVSPRDRVEATEHYDAFGNLCRRLVAPPGGIILRAKGIIHHSGFLEDRDSTAMAAPPDLLAAEFAGKLFFGKTAQHKTPAFQGRRTTFQVGLRFPTEQEVEVIQCQGLGKVFFT